MGAQKETNDTLARGSQRSQMDVAPPTARPGDEPHPSQHLHCGQEEATCPATALVLLLELRRRKRETFAALDH